MPTLTPEIISAAIEGFESQKRRIDEQIAGLRAMLDESPIPSQTATSASTTRKRRTLSAAGRARIAEAQRKRWAALKGEAGPVTPEAPKPKRKLSAAAKAKLVANLKRARAAKAVKAKAGANKAALPRKKAALKRAAVKTATAKAAKRAPVKNLATKKTETNQPQNAPVATPVPTTSE